MSSFVLMKILESAPERYDWGIHLLFGDLIERVYREIAERVAAPGAYVLDVGCGTGKVSLACAAKGARVVGIDVSPAMLDVARSRQVAEGVNERVQWLELGAAEIEDRFPERSFDAVVSCLAFSEMYPDEQSFVLTAARSRIKEGGTLLIADEVRPETRGGRLWSSLRRAPAVAVTFLISQTTTRPIDQLQERVRAAGFPRVVEERLPPGDFALVQAWRA
jgi:demethylmenaquinone methyltransferase/2-methoxy-6-polyprenyl-1,4-benzoquinol methylase